MSYFFVIAVAVVRVDVDEPVTTGGQARTVASFLAGKKLMFWKIWRHDILLTWYRYTDKINIWH